MRLLNRPLALLLAAALAATGIIIAIEVIAFAVGAKHVVVPWPSWQHWASTTHWNRAVIKVWAVILIVVGLIFLLSQLKPRRVTRLSLTSSDDHTDAAITRKGLAGAVRAAVLDVDGIAKADTVAARRRVTVSATSSAQDSEAAKELTDPVHDAAQAQIDSLGLTKKIRVRTTVKGAKT